MAPRIWGVIEIVPSFVVALPLGNRLPCPSKVIAMLYVTTFVTTGRTTFPPVPMAVFVDRTHTTGLADENRSPRQRRAVEKECTRALVSYVSKVSPLSYQMFIFRLGDVISHL